MNDTCTSCDIHVYDNMCVRDLNAQKYNVINKLLKQANVLDPILLFFWNSIGLQMTLDKRFFKKFEGKIEQ